MSGQYLLSSIILFGGIQGLFLVFTLQRIKSANQSANRILSIFVSLISLVLFSRLVYVEGVEIWKEYPHLFLLPDIPMFLYGPLFYFYIEKLIGEKEKRRKANWQHFIPAILHSSILIFYLFESKATYLLRLNTGDLIELPYAVWGSLSHMAIYLYFGYALFQKNLKKDARQQRFSFGKKYLYSFFLLTSICWFSWLYAVLAETFSILPNNAFFNYNLAWIAFSFASFILVYFAMSKPEVFRTDPNQRKYEGSLMKEEELDFLEKKLSNLMVTEKPFCNPLLSQQALADRMGLPSKDLSRLINERFCLNFFEFVNNHRVEEFKRLSTLSEKEHLTLLAIAQEAGFNSKTTFNNAFKKSTGLTPTQFKKATQNN